MDEQEAQESLENAVEADSQAQSQPTETEAQETTPEQPEQPFTNLDPSNLPEDLQTIYKSMQGDYTRKTQEISEMRKAYEALGQVDPTEATAALQFVQQLQNDPNFALEVHQNLTQALIQAGMTPQEAQVAATETLTETEDFGEQQDDPRDAQLQELLEWKQAQESRQEEMEIASELSRQEMAIRQAHPDYSEQDIDYIYSLAFAHGGDLKQARESYESMKSDFINHYLTAKTQIPANTPNSTGSGQTPPPKFESFEDAHTAAEEHLRQVLAAQEN